MCCCGPTEPAKRSCPDQCQVSFSGIYEHFHRTEIAGLCFDDTHLQTNAFSDHPDAKQSQNSLVCHGKIRDPQRQNCSHSSKQQIALCCGCGIDFAGCVAHTKKLIARTKLRRDPTRSSRISAQPGLRQSVWSREHGQGKGHRKYNNVVHSREVRRGKQSYYQCLCAHFLVN